MHEKLRKTFKNRSTEVNAWNNMQSLDFGSILQSESDNKPQFEAEPHVHLFSENSWEHWVRIGEQVMCGSAFVIMHRIDSRHFQIFRKDEYWWEYWWIPYVKVNSRNYVSAYARTHEKFTNIWYSPILVYSRRIDICEVPPLP